LLTFQNYHAFAKMMERKFITLRWFATNRQRGTHLWWLTLAFAHKMLLWGFESAKAAIEQQVINHL
jgi:hypothetical protein